MLLQSFLFGVPKGFCLYLFRRKAQLILKIFVQPNTKSCFPGNIHRGAFAYAVPADLADDVFQYIPGRLQEAEIALREDVIKKMQLAGGIHNARCLAAAPCMAVQFIQVCQRRNITQEKMVFCIVNFPSGSRK